MGNFRDLYIVRWLLQNTQSPSGSIVWQRRESGPYFAEFNKGSSYVQIIIGSTFRPALIDLKFTSPGLGEVHIQEPLKALFSLKYMSEDDEELAKAMRRLAAIVASQHAKKEMQEIENTEERKQKIFQRLISGDS